MAKEIIEGFKQYFDMVFASTEQLKNEVYQLRYQVYCIETKFERPEDFPAGLEIDESDQFSAHYLIKHHSRGYAATTRLVLPDMDSLTRKFPIEEHCDITNHEVMNKIPRQHLAEVSRFCVSKEFKQRKGESGTLTGVSSEHDDYFSDDERRVFPHITLALIACLVKMSQEHEIYHWYAVMEPSLLRFLKRLGIVFTNIGPLADYHGERQPCVITVSEMLAGVFDKNRQVWDLLTDRGRYV